MSGHVEQKKILFLCGKDSLFHQVLGESFSDIAQLVSQLQRVPRLTAQIFDPTHHILRWLGLFDMFERFVQYHISGGLVVLQKDLKICIYHNVIRECYCNWCSIYIYDELLCTIYDIKFYLRSLSFSVNFYRTLSYLNVLKIFL